VEGRQVLMFWYRNEIYAIEARSPAEGAYSEGFIRAKFTQVGVICTSFIPCCLFARCRLMLQHSA
jgi:hypothetical protein